MKSNKNCCTKTHQRLKIDNLLTADIRHDQQQPTTAIATRVPVYFIIIIEKALDIVIAIRQTHSFYI